MGLTILLIYAVLINTMASFGEKTYLQTLSSLTTFTGFSLTEKVNVKQKVCLCLVPMLTYLYVGLMLLRDWKVTDDINDFLYTVALIIGLPSGLIMRFQRSRLAKLLILLENVPMDDKRVKSNLNAIVKKVVTILFPLAPIVLGTGLVAWYTSYSKDTLPFGSMPSWAMEFSTNMCLVFQVITYLFMGQEFLMWYGMKWTILFQLREHFKYLNTNIRNYLGTAIIDYQESLYLTLNVPWSHKQKHIKYIAVRHNYLSLAAKEAELVFNKAVLISFLNLSVLFCIILLRLSKISSINMEACTLLFYIVVNLAIFSGDTFLCQQVVTESERLHSSYYEIDFVGTDVRFQKALVFLMTRAQRPAIFTIGNFAPLSMGAVVTVLKASVSYFMLLNQINDR